MMKSVPKIWPTLSVALALLSAPVSALEKKPNIILMLTDNLGYGDIGSYGGGAVRGMPTPRLDALADEGLRLTNFNVEPECTPSRAALMTGRMPIRSGTSSVDVYGGKDGLTPWEYTLAELLSDAGYKTAMFGKWHLGSAEERLPHNQGFDEFYGVPRSSADTNWELQPGYDREVTVVQPVLEGRRGEKSREVRSYNYAFRPLIDREVTDRAVAYVKAKAGEDAPFFLYVPFTGPHGPPLPHPDFDVPGRSDYQNKIMELDSYAGEILDAVDSAGIVEDTIVIWASENGPQTMHGIGLSYGGQSDSGPFRGEFPSAWEGAIRVPALIRWPGHIEPREVSNEIVSILDFYRTLATVAGAADRVPADRPMDSIDQAPFMFGDQKTSNRESVMFFYGQDLLAIKWRQFKMHLTMRDVTRGQVVVPGQSLTHGVKVEPAYPWIFDIENDPKELWDISTTNGWLAKTAGRIIGAYRGSVAKFSNITPGSEGPVKKK